jgi:hypothetical protein
MENYLIKILLQITIILCFVFKMLMSTNPTDIHSPPPHHVYLVRDCSNLPSCKKLFIIQKFSGNKSCFIWLWSFDRDHLIVIIWSWSFDRDHLIVIISSIWRRHQAPNNFKHYRKKINMSPTEIPQMCRILSWTLVCCTPLCQLSYFFRYTSHLIT